MKLRLGNALTLCKTLNKLLFVLFALSTPSYSSCEYCTHYALKERHPVPDGWTAVRQAPSDHRIQLHIGLKQGRFHELERHLIEGEFAAQR